MAIMFQLCQHLITVCLLLASGLALAQFPGEIERNTGRRGSSCDRGFKKSHGKCVRIKVPLNGKLNALHNDWVCKRGFRKVGQRCLKIRIPKNANLNYRGDDWTCKSGFFKVSDECVQIRLEDGNEVRE